MHRPLFDRRDAENAEIDFIFRLPGNDDKRKNYLHAAVAAGVTHFVGRPLPMGKRCSFLSGLCASAVSQIRVSVIMKWKTKAEFETCQGLCYLWAHMGVL